MPLAYRKLNHYSPASLFTFRRSLKPAISRRQSGSTRYSASRTGRHDITTGNLAGNDRASLFWMDDAKARRIKLWRHAPRTGDADLANVTATLSQRAARIRQLEAQLTNALDGSPSP